jgi:hypothetical protein
VDFARLASGPVIFATFPAQFRTPAAGAIFITGCFHSFIHLVFLALYCISELWLPESFY